MDNALPVDTDTLLSMLKADPESLDLAMLEPLGKAMDNAGDSVDIPPDVQALQQVVDMLSAEQVRRLDALAEDCQDSFGNDVRAKRPIEDRWIDDERQDAGRPMANRSKMLPADSTQPAGEDDIVCHATRSQRVMFASRMADMMLPGNTIPMRIDPAENPDPTLFGMPANMDRAALTDLASTRADVVNNQLAKRMKAAYLQREGRIAINDMALLGTGVLKGPFPDYQQKRKQRPGNPDIVMAPLPGFGICRVDPRKVYGEMTRSFATTSRVHEVHIKTQKQLMDFGKLPKIIRRNLDELSDVEHPVITGPLADSISKRNELSQLIEPLDDVYAMVETTRVLKPNRYREITGQDWNFDEPPLIQIWWCNGKALKFRVTPLERDWRVNYYELVLFPIDDTMWGGGVPFLGRAADRMMRGAMNATLRNAAASVAPFLLVAQGKVQPNAEDWKLNGLNIFSVENGDEPLKNFFDSINVNSNVEGNLNLLKVAQDMMNADTLYSQILQGAPSGESMPASLHVNLVNNNSLYQRDIANRSDDTCWQPLGERGLWYEQMYNLGPDGNPDPQYQGDFEVKGIAGSTLVSKDLANQHLQVALQISQGEEFAGYTDSYEKLAAIFDGIDFPRKDAILLPKEAAKAAQQQIQSQKTDPKVQIAMAQIAAEKEIKALDRQLKMQELASNERKFAAELNVQLETIKGRVMERQLTLQADLVALQTKKEVDVTKVMANVKKATLDSDTQKFLGALDATVTTHIEQAKINATPSPYSNKD